MRIDFWDVSTKEDIIDNFYFEFPDEILIANTLSLLKFTDDFINLKSDNGTLDLDDYKFDNVRQDFFKKQNKYI